MASVRFFAQAREAAAGTREVVIDGATVADVIKAAVERYGDGLGRVIAISTIWVNGEQAGPSDPVGVDDELAILPPVSGGA